MSSEAFLRVRVATRRGGTAEFGIENLSKGTGEVRNGVRLDTSPGEAYRLTVVPPDGDRVSRITYRVSTPLCNYHQVIVPDTGRTYSGQMQLVNFWAKRWESRVNNVRMPVFILTGQDMCAAYVFGVIGANVETDFSVQEPAARRALSAWMKRLTLQVERGTEEYPLPDSVAGARDDGAITEHLYFRRGDELSGRDWVSALRGFSDEMARILDLAPREAGTALLPWWCSWTDWYSGDVTDRVVLDNVRDGLALGIKNYIVDDGWFGPGLDSDLDVALNIGDWDADPAKFPGLRALASEMRAMGARAIIWCAPHAVAPGANCFPERKRYLLQTDPGTDFLTGNHFHSLCFMCPQAREIMAGICAGLAERYDVAGAKYDLFNCVPSSPCVSAEHEHDTTSMVEGLTRTLELIDRRTAAVNADYLVELKQNYATPYLYGYGSVVRAGDTPYNPEGNFLRTAYIGAYTPYCLNDYQTITNNDPAPAAAAMIVKMMAVGVPAYSIDLTKLSTAHKDALRFYHEWYSRRLECLRLRREPQDPSLGPWRARGADRDVYFLVNGENRLSITEPRECEVVNGTFRTELLLGFPRELGLEVRADNVGRPAHFERAYRAARSAVVPMEPGDILTLRFTRGR